MAEPHDRCTLLGCTLGREHTSEHLGPRCPVCGVPGLWSGVARAWLCRSRACAHDTPIPVPAEPARQPMPAAAPTCNGTVNGRPCGRPAIGRYLNCPGSWRCGEHAIPTGDWTEIATATPMPAAALLARAALAETTSGGNRSHLLGLADECQRVAGEL